MGIAGRVVGHWRIVHPFPTVAVTLASLGFGWLAAGGPTPGLPLLVATVFASQVAIGSLNDYLDRERDAVEQPEKPIPSGLLPAKSALIQAILASAICLVIASFTGLLGLIFAGLALVSGLSYDIRLKGTMLSFLPYLVSFSCLPAFAWAATGRFEPRWLALYAVGLPLMLSLHIANALPDIAGDQRAGVNGLAPTLGYRRARNLCWAGYLAALLLASATIAIADQARAILAAGLTSSAVLLALAIYVASDRKRSSLLNHFRFLAVGGLVLAASAMLVLR